MPRRSRNSLWSKTLAANWRKMAKSAGHSTARVMRSAIKNSTVSSKPAKPGKTRAPGSGRSVWLAGVAVSAAGVRRYRFFQPGGVRPTERLPLLVMLHGCGQDAEALARCSGMNKLAEKRRFLVLYPEQERSANAQNCWNWFGTRSGRAQREADSIQAAIKQVAVLYPVDPARVMVAGLSAGAGMAALMATRFPTHFRAVAMHSGIAPGQAHSSATAMMAMQGRRLAAAPLPVGVKLPPLLVIQGSEDRVVAPVNGPYTAQQWALQREARQVAPRQVQRGARYPVRVTDFRAGVRVVVSLCEVLGLAHAWSGGAAGQPYSDPKGPDAASLIWAFAQKQFASG